jgi:uncharacterized RDD family membrane protein YckC
MTSERYQTLWRRFWAVCVDILVFAPIAIADHFFWKGSAPVPVRAAWILIFSCLSTAHSVFGHGLYGRTVGKWLLGIRVLDVSGAPLRMWQAVVRDSLTIAFLAWRTIPNLGSILHGIRQTSPPRHGLGASGWISLIWFLLEVVTVLASPRRRALHDLLAGSVVVRTTLDRERASA